MTTNIYVVSYIKYTAFGEVEWIVDMAFRMPQEAEQYIKEQEGKDKYCVAYVVNEVSFEDSDKKASS